MNPQRQKEPANAGNEVYLTHVFNAPRELVFNAWTDPAQLLKWFAPKGCSIRYEQIDVREGGQYHSCIQDPVHGECWCKGSYLEIGFPERIVYTIEMSDREGNDVIPQDAGKDGDWPAKTILTVSFTEEDGKTRLSLHQTVAAELAGRTGALQGWTSMLERLTILIEANQSKN